MPQRTRSRPVLLMALRPRPTLSHKVHKDSSSSSSKRHSSHRTPSLPAHKGHRRTRPHRKVMGCRNHRLRLLQAKGVASLFQDEAVQLVVVGVALTLPEIGCQAEVQREVVQQDVVDVVVAEEDTMQAR